MEKQSDSIRSRTTVAIFTASTLIVALILASCATPKPAIEYCRTAGYLDKWLPVTSSNGNDLIKMLVRENPSKSGFEGFLNSWCLGCMGPVRDEEHLFGTCYERRSNFGSDEFIKVSTNSAGQLLIKKAAISNRRLDRLHDRPYSEITDAVYYPYHKIGTYGGWEKPITEDYYPPQFIAAIRGHSEEVAAEKSAAIDYIHRAETTAPARLASLMDKAKAITGTFTFKGFYLGMPIEDAAALMRIYIGQPTHFPVMKREDGGLWTYSGLFDNTAINASSDGKVYRIRIKREHVNLLFNVANMKAEEFKNMFVSAYKIPKMEYDYYKWYYTDLDKGYRVTIGENGYLLLESVASKANTKFD